MKNSYLFEQNKVFIIMALLVFVLLTTVILVFYFISQNQPTTTVSIKNYGDYEKTLPPSERESIETMLFNTIDSNLENIEQQKLDDVYIRDGSYSQELVGDNYNTEFIVDIESIKQSYKVTNTYPRQGRQAGQNYDYNILVFCLPKQDLKYGEFKCLDRISQEKGLQAADPIASLLPHATLDYLIEIGDSSAEGDKLNLAVTIYLSQADYNSGVDASIKLRKEAINSWFESHNLNPDNYIINYVY